MINLTGYCQVDDVSANIGSSSAMMRQHRYGRRSLVETAISRVKRINGGRLTSRTFGAQQNEVAIHIKIANRNMLLARPQSQRIR